MTDETARLLIVGLSKLASAVNQLTAVITPVAHDVRSIREQNNRIEARLPYPKRKKAANA